MRRTTGSDEDGVLQGTLDMLVLRALQLEPMHGWGIAERIEQWSKQVFQLGQGTLYPSLYRLERHGLIDSMWQVSANNRRAAFTRLPQQDDGSLPARSRRGGSSRMP